MKSTKLTVCVLFVFIMVINMTHVFALDNTGFSKPEDKISEGLAETMKKTNSNDLLNVWVWIRDINTSEANKRVEMTTGYSEDDINNMFNDNDFVELAKELNDRSTGKDKTSLLKKCKERNKVKREKIREYKRKRVKVYDSMYSVHNNRIIDDLALDREKIGYICSLTPSFIIEITKNEIKRLAESNFVVRMLLYEDDCNTKEKNIGIMNDTGELSQYDTIVTETQLKSMHADVAQDYGYTGEDVNILFIGGAGYISLPDPTDLSDIDMENPDTVENVFNNESHPITDNTHQPGNHSPHTHFCTKVLRRYSPDSHIYIVNKDGFINGNGQFNDIVYAIEEKDIDLLCVAMEYSNGYSYFDSSDAIWFDAITKRYNLVLVSSASNDAYGNYHYVSSPGTCYNSIAVGAFEAQENGEDDEMYNYRYNPVIGTTFPTFKPDVVAAGDSTSISAPVVAGIISWALEMNGDLLNKPQAVKAIVLASCHRKAKTTNLPNSVIQENMIDGLTQRQGAGIIDAYRIMKSAAEISYGIIHLSTNSSYYFDDLVYNSGYGNYGTVNYNDYLNVSLAWYVGYTQLGNTPEFLTSSISNVQDIALNVLDNLVVKSSSSAINSCKQVAYFDNAESHHTYKIRVDNITPSNEIEAIDIGYAWSERGKNELTSLNFQGFTIPGSTLYANALMQNNQVADTGEVLYTWESSSDGLNWEVLNESSENYTVSSSDFLKYLKCTASPRTTSLLAKNEVFTITQTKVYIYGDVNTDGFVNNTDCWVLNQYLSEIINNLSDESLAAADVNLDGIIDVIDLTLISRYIDGLINQLPFLIN